MFRNRFWLLGAVLGLSILMLTAPASAWEFSMKGSYVWQYGYRSQMGNGGFFGPYDVDNSAGSNLHAVNAWLGTHSNNLQSFQTGIALPAPFIGAFNPGEIVVSGHDGGWDTIWMDNWMELRINPAIRVRGLYHIGEWAVTTGTQTTTGFLQGEGALVQSEYQNFSRPGVKRSFSPGYWNLLWLTAQLPWGEFAIGKRPSAFGTGLMWNGEDSRSSENFSLFASYGPLRIGGGFYWGRSGSDGFTTDAFDKSGFRIYDITFPAITYRNGPLDAGMQFLYLKRHRGGDRRNQGPVLTTKNTDFRDRSDFYGAVYTKYNNGRFFFNAELDWYDRIDRLGRQAFFNADPDRSADLFIQHYRFMTELGFLCGPAKMSLLYSWSSGNDRRGALANGATSGGIPNINQGTLNEPTNNATGGLVQSTTASNTGLYRPYSYLMVYSYGLGTHIEGDTGNGYVEDASCYAARLDYAVASNLNLYGSFFWADRVGNAYGWGFLKPVTLAAQAAPNGTAFPAVNGIGSGYVPGAPTIPDNNLGWEVDTGFDWKLLEGLTVNATFAYWQPGRWFNFACIDKSLPAWSAQAAPTFGTNPSRNIDGIFAVDLKVVGDF